MSYRVTLYSDPTHPFTVLKDETILEAAHRQGVDIPSSCESGICTTCKGKLYQGTITYGDVVVQGIDPNNARGEALFCVAKPTSDVVIDHPDLPLPYPTKTALYQVRERFQYHPRVTCLRLVPQQGVVDFVAGQYVELYVDEHTRFPFSIASTPQAPFLELHVQRDAHHPGAQAVLDACALGATLRLRLPLGRAYWRALPNPVILVAGGSGFAPIKSLLETYLAMPDCPVMTLYWGVRTPDLLYFQDTLKAYQQQHSHFTYIPVVSEPSTRWTGRLGLVTDAICDDFPNLAEHVAYLAGPFEMSYHARKAFIAQGIAREHLYSDAFAFESSVPDTGSV